MSNSSSFGSCFLSTPFFLSKKISGPFFESPDNRLDSLFGRAVAFVDRFDLLVERADFLIPLRFEVLEAEFRPVDVDLCRFDLFVILNYRVFLEPLVYVVEDFPCRLHHRRRLVVSKLAHPVPLLTIHEQP